MKETGGIFRIILSSLCCAAIMMCSAYDLINGSLKISTSLTANKPVLNQEKAPEVPTEEAAQNPQENTSTQTEESSAVQTSGSDTAAGKIVEKFISPYTVKTSYNNVYLKNSTDLSVDIKSLLSAKLPYKIEKNGEPQVLIMHTHATESFMQENRDYYTASDSSRTTDNTKNMVELGRIVAEKLNAAGIVTLHDETQHDYPSYNESYSRAANTICSYTEKYSSIKIVIDLHRDAIAANDTDKVKLTAEINGKKAAQVMLVMGSQSGSVKNFPNYEENLKLAVKLQQTFEVMYPSLARALSLMPKNYNESLTTGSMLIEIGTDGNTMEEVKYSAELVGNALVSLLNTL